MTEFVGQWKKVYNSLDWHLRYQVRKGNLLEKKEEQYEFAKRLDSIETGLKEKVFMISTLRSEHKKINPKAFDKVLSLIERHVFAESLSEEEIEKIIRYHIEREKVQGLFLFLKEKGVQLSSESVLVKDITMKCLDMRLYSLLSEILIYLNIIIDPFLHKLCLGGQITAQQKSYFKIYQND